MDALYLGNFKRSVNKNTSFFPYGILKHLGNETGETKGWRGKWQLIAEYGLIPAAKIRQSWLMICTHTTCELWSRAPEQIHSFWITALLWPGRGRGKSVDLWCFAPWQIWNRLFLPHEGTRTIYRGIRVIHRLENSFLMQAHYSDGSSSMWNNEAGLKKISPNNGKKKKRNRWKSLHSSSSTTPVVLTVDRIAFDIQLCLYNLLWWPRIEMSSMNLVPQL